MSRSASDWEIEEWKRIRERRGRAFRQATKKENPQEPPKNVVGLALSGGGIRSALYNCLARDFTCVSNVDCHLSWQRNDEHSCQRQRRDLPE